MLSAKPAPKRRRLPVMLTDEQHEWLEAEAAARGVSIATVVRWAIDRMRAADTEEQS